jgi:hypothetical protein
MVWRILSIAVCVFAGLCLFFFIFQRPFIYMPAPATAQHDAASPLQVPGARLRITTRPLDGPKALVYFRGQRRGRGLHGAGVGGRLSLTGPSMHCTTEATAAAPDGSQKPICETMRGRSSKWPATNMPT